MDLAHLSFLSTEMCIYQRCFYREINQQFTVHSVQLKRHFVRITCIFSNNESNVKKYYILPV
jgi:hypothetical protein